MNIDFGFTPSPNLSMRERLPARARAAARARLAAGSAALENKVNLSHGQLGTQTGAGLTQAIPTTPGPTSASVGPITPILPAGATPIFPSIIPAPPASASPIFSFTTPAPPANVGVISPSNPPATPTAAASAAQSAAPPTAPKSILVTKPSPIDISKPGAKFNFAFQPQKKVTFASPGANVSETPDVVMGGTEEAEGLIAMDPVKYAHLKDGGVTADVNVNPKLVHGPAAQTWHPSFVNTNDMS
ncbi:hypothetical protein BJX70DRAFT_393547 [Aspergillus crustosus]